MRRLAGLLLTLALLLPVSAWAADSSITTPDTGVSVPGAKLLDTKTVTTGAGSVHRQGVVICDPTGTTCGPVVNAGTTGGTGQATVQQNATFGNKTVGDTPSTDNLPVFPCVVGSAAPNYTTAKLAPCRVLTDGTLVVGT